MWIGEQAGQGWVQIGELGMAFLLSAIIGLEREIRHKSAGLRAYACGFFGRAHHAGFEIWFRAMS
jgi:putative Mg2+ transporter-C (MgtC) family protein